MFVGLLIYYRCYDVVLVNDCFSCLVCGICYFVLIVVLSDLLFV